MNMALQYYNLNIQRMGNSTASKEQPWILKYYKYVETTMEEPFGIISIFKKKQENYDYIILLNKVIDKAYKERIQQELAVLSNKKHGPFLKIYQIVIGNQPLMQSLQLNHHIQKQNMNKNCLKVQPQHEIINIFMEYSNYTLKDHIQYKKRSRQQISCKDYAYVIRRSLFAALIYEESQFHFMSLDISSSSCFVMLDGHVKWLPFRSHFLKEETGMCQVMKGNCCIKNDMQIGPNNRHRNTKKIEGVSVYLKNKDNKYLTQVKLLSHELISTVSQKTSGQNDNSLLLSTHSQIQKAKSLKEMIAILSVIKDDGGIELKRDSMTLNQSLHIQNGNQEIYNKIKHEYIRLQNTLREKDDQEFLFMENNYNDRAMISKRINQRSHKGNTLIHKNMQPQNNGSQKTSISILPTQENLPVYINRHINITKIR